MNKDNQQATLIKNLSYLAGIIDADGSIGVNKSKQKNSYTYTPRCGITNSNSEIINKVIKIIDEMNVKAYIFEKSRNNDKWKNCYEITVRKLISLKILLENLIPYLYGKKSQAELTLRFVNSRLSAMEKKNIIKQGKNGKIIECIRTDNYKEEEINLFDQLRKLNKRGASTTTR